jgi:hypothetical protein
LYLDVRIARKKEKKKRKLHTLVDDRARFLELRCVDFLLPERSKPRGFSVNIPKFSDDAELNALARGESLDCKNGSEVGTTGVGVASVFLSRRFGHAMPDSPTVTSVASARGDAIDELVFVVEDLPPPPPDLDISSAE